MARVGMHAIALCFAAAAIGATAYDDFSIGLNALNRDDAETAIAAFSRALAAGDLAPGYVPTARIGRARAYLHKERCREALADLDEALKIKSDSVDAYVFRAAANSCLNKDAEALADIEQAIKLRPSAAVYEEAARYKWTLGHFPEAAEDYAHAVALSSKTNPRLSYIVLWHAMTADRAGTLDQALLATERREIDDDEWPGEAVKLFEGKSTVDRVSAQAVSRDPQRNAEQKCEADFYIGEWQLARKNQAAALILLNQAAAECPKNFVEFFAAKVEIKRQQ